MRGRGRAHRRQHRGDVPRIIEAVTGNRIALREDVVDTMVVVGLRLSTHRFSILRSSQNIIASDVRGRRDVDPGLGHRGSRIGGLGSHSERNLGHKLAVDVRVLEHHLRTLLDSGLGEAAGDEDERTTGDRSHHRILRSGFKDGLPRLDLIIEPEPLDLGDRRSRVVVKQRFSPGNDFLGLTQREQRINRLDPRGRSQRFAVSLIGIVLNTHQVEVSRTGLGTGGKHHTQRVLRNGRTGPLTQSHFRPGMENIGLISQQLTIIDAEVVAGGDLQRSSKIAHLGVRFYRKAILGIGFP